jgi:cbb3-type cytochrome oxidase subunit 3
MTISDFVSRLTPSFGAEAGVVVFATLFVVLAIRLFSRRQAAALEAARSLPLDDDDAPRGGGR